MPLRVLLVTVVTVVTVCTLSVAGLWWYATRPQDISVEAYALRTSTTILAQVTVSANEQFVAAYAEETPTVVKLHVITRSKPGSYPAIALMASERITLQAPIGDREVQDYNGTPLRKVPLGRIAVGSVSEAISQFSG